jgi:gamma-D-glutamyl-L-lysine dipeptidyl-peptidase
MEKFNKKWICAVAISPMRSEPSHKAEMVSQLLYGEMVQIIDTKPDWVGVRGDFDGYEGWCQLSHVVSKRYGDKSKLRQVLNASWVGKLESKHITMRIPFGSWLDLDAKNYVAWSKDYFRFSGKCYDPLRRKKSKSEIRTCAYQFLGTPYLWGGKTVFGTDCSGFTQTVFKFFDIPLRRDAWQQAEQGQKIENISDSKFGDLAFFSNDRGKITHVGILLGKEKIIHASGKVRIDLIDGTGIKNSESGERTHSLALIKRYF